MICGQVLDLSRRDEIGATTHFIGDKSDPLWRYSDGAFHVACFETWEHREEFEAKYKQVLGRAVEKELGDRPPDPPFRKKD